LLSVSAELEELQKKRAELKSALASLEKKEKTLGENPQMTEEEALRLLTHTELGVAGKS
jgi:hypothetical protein